MNFHLRIPHPEMSFGWHRIEHWLPPRGSVIFTLLVVFALLWAQNAGALLTTPAVASTGTIASRGRLADAAGSPVTNTVNMVFRLYAAAGDGLFNVRLPSMTPIPQAVLSGNPNLFLGGAVGTDSEMTSRVQLDSAPLSRHQLAFVSI